MTSSLVRLALLGASTLGLANCAGPTYGTGVSQGQQFFDDINNAVSFGKDREKIDYSPRPDLVRPTNTAALPPPQAPREKIVVARDTSAERAAMVEASRVRDDAGTDRSTLPAASDTAASRSWLSPAELRGQSQAATARTAESRQGSANTRRYLSEPPLTYRAPASTAPVGDQGVDEETKERRLNGDKSLFSKLKNALPF